MHFLPDKKVKYHHLFASARSIISFLYLGRKGQIIFTNIVEGANWVRRGSNALSSCFFEGEAHIFSGAMSQLVPS